MKAREHVEILVDGAYIAGALSGFGSMSACAARKRNNGNSA